MSTSTVYDAIKAKLVADLGASYPIRDFEEIEVALQQDDAPWIAIEDGLSNDTLTSIGTPQQNWVEDAGFIDVHIFVRSAGPLASARTIGELVRNSLRYWRDPTVPAGETLAIDSVAPPSTGLIYDGMWSSMLVSVQYTHRYAVPTAAAAE